jgi:hypothetical protein
MPAPKKPEERSPIVPDDRTEIPMEELEERLEMQRVPSMDPSLACYTDLCPADCGTHCTAGYSGCIDLCNCDGMKCVTECAELCVVESCLVDIV